MACMSSRRAIGVFKALSEEVKGRFAQIPWGERGGGGEGGEGERGRGGRGGRGGGGRGARGEGRTLRCVRARACACVPRACTRRLTCPLLPNVNITRVTGARTTG
jgi:hypothetical protein